jgi:hypothetical protein
VHDVVGGIVYVTMIDGAYTGKQGGFLVREIEPAPAKLKVGDRVRYVGENDTAFYTNGKDYAVVKADGDRYVLEDNQNAGPHHWSEVAMAGQFIPAPPLQIETGRFYKTRDGRKVGPMRKYDYNSWTDIENGYLWREDGLRYFESDRGNFDLIAQWPTEPANDNPAQPTIGTAIVCVFKDGKPAPASSPRVHETTDSARTEAKRLGGINKGETYGVYKLVATHVQAKPAFEHEWQRLAADGRKIEAIGKFRGITGLGLKASKDAVEDWMRTAA